MKNIELTMKIVDINGIKRGVSANIEYTDKGIVIHGLLNKTRYSWHVSKFAVPYVAVPDIDKNKAANFGRQYILKRLKMDGIDINITNPREVVEDYKYNHYRLGGKSWARVYYKNRNYAGVDVVHITVRGNIDGKPFYWDTNKAPMILSEQYDGTPIDVMDKNIIMSLFKKYHNIDDLNKTIAPSAF